MKNNEKTVSEHDYAYFGSKCITGTGKVLCKLCDRKECNGCSYTWRGTAPACYDSCLPGEMLVAKDRYGDGTLCSSGTYNHMLCESCRIPVYDRSKCNAPGPWLGSAKLCAGECEVGQVLFDRNKVGDGGGDYWKTCYDSFGWKVRCQTCPLLASASAAQEVSAAAAPRCFKRKCSKPVRGSRFDDKPAFVVRGATTYAACCKVCRTSTGCVRFGISARSCAIYRTKPNKEAVRAAGHHAVYYRKA